MSRARTSDLLYEVLSLCFQSIGVKTLARFATCSHRCHQVSRSICQQHFHQLLPPLLRLAVQAGDEDFSKQRIIADNALCWVISAAGAEAMSSIGGSLARIPRVPLGLAAAMLRFGVAISHEQLVAAARDRVPGVEAWGCIHNKHLSSVVMAVCSEHKVGVLLHSSWGLQ